MFMNAPLRMKTVQQQLYHNNEQVFFEHKHAEEVSRTRVFDHDDSTRWARVGKNRQIRHL